MLSNRISKTSSSFTLNLYDPAKYDLALSDPLSHPLGGLNKENQVRSRITNLITIILNCYISIFTDYSKVMIILVNSIPLFGILFI